MNQIKIALSRRGELGPGVVLEADLVVIQEVAHEVVVEVVSEMVSEVPVIRMMQPFR